MKLAAQEFGIEIKSKGRKMLECKCIVVKSFNGNEKTIKTGCPLHEPGYNGWRNRDTWMAHTILINDLERDDDSIDDSIVIKCNTCTKYVLRFHKTK